jgi:ribosome biogenesis GTPase
LSEGSADLEAIGFDDARRAEMAAMGDEFSPARVTRIDRGMATVRSESGDTRVTTPVGIALAVGDWVVLASNGALHSVLERRGAVSRLVGHEHQTLQVVAANVDLIFLVRPLDLSISPGRIQAMLTLSYDSGATPVVLLTKADLAEEPSEFVESIASLAPGVEVVVASVVTGEGIERVRQLAQGRTIVFLGESGGGKSTLTNLLVGEELLAVGTTKAGGQGRHTTSHRELVALPGGGAIIDTPGVREVVAAISRDAVDAGFADIAELASRCRFADCTHGAEPGCAVAAALADGSLDPARYDAYDAAMRDAAWNERRVDKAAQAELRKQYRAMTRERRSDSW